MTIHPVLTDAQEVNNTTVVMTAQMPLFLSWGPSAVHISHQAESGNIYLQAQKKKKNVDFSGIH